MKVVTRKKQKKNNINQIAIYMLITQVTVSKSSIQYTPKLDACGVESNQLFFSWPKKKSTIFLCLFPNK